MLEFVAIVSICISNNGLKLSLVNDGVQLLQDLSVKNVALLDNQVLIKMHEIFKHFV